MSNLGEQPVHKYERGADILAQAASSFGIEVPDASRQEWRAILGSIYELDQCLDSNEPKDVRMTTYNSSLAVIVGNGEVEADTPEHVRTLRGFTETWPEPKLIRFFDVMDEWKEVTGEKRIAKTARTLGSISLHEGEMCGLLFSVPDVSESKAGQFEKWLSNLIAGGTVVDAAVDLPQDYEDGLVQVKPTRLNQAVLLGMATPSLVKTLSKVNRVLIKSLLGATAALGGNNTERPIPQQKVA